MSHVIRQYGFTTVHIFSTPTERDTFISSHHECYTGSLYLVRGPDQPILCPVSCSRCPLDSRLGRPDLSCRERAHIYTSTLTIYRRSRCVI